MTFLEHAYTPSSVTSPVNIPGVFIGLSWGAFRDGKIRVHIVLLSGVKRWEGSIIVAYQQWVRL